MLAVAALVCTFSQAARADDESDRAAADRLAAILHDQAQMDGSTRIGVIVGLLVGGAVSTGIGVPLLVDGLSRPSPSTADDQIEIIGGTVLTAFGAAALLSWPLAFLHTPSERLEGRVRSLATLPPHERLVRMEAALSSAAADERWNRKTSATLAFIAGALNAAIVPLDVVADNRGLAVVNGAVAVFAILSGAIQLVSPGALERTWRTWLVGTGRTAAIQWTPSRGGLAFSF
jgi:hypothetical protein